MTPTPSAPAHQALRAGRARLAVLLAGLVLTTPLAGCGWAERPTARPAELPASGTPGATEPSARTSSSPLPTSAATPTSAASPSPTPSLRRPAPSERTASQGTGRSSCAPGGAAPRRLSLRGQQGVAFAFAPLKRPEDVTVEGSVPDTAAWSTSKVLVVAAFLDTAAGGRPARLAAGDRRLIEAALTRSDADAVTAVRDRIPGRPGPAMTRVLRSVGDTTTVAPDSFEGTMGWSLREQVRFMAALQAGKVVSQATSDYLLQTMRPIRAHSWGLGRIGATAFKGGWLRQDRATRQMGLVDGYAVAITTDRGRAVQQTDGDAAHVAAMDELARLLQERLALDAACR